MSARELKDFSAWNAVKVSDICLCLKLDAAQILGGSSSVSTPCSGERRGSKCLTMNEAGVGRGGRTFVSRSLLHCDGLRVSSFICCSRLSSPGFSRLQGLGASGSGAETAAAVLAEQTLVVLSPFLLYFRVVPCKEYLKESNVLQSWRKALPDVAFSRMVGQARAGSLLHCCTIVWAREMRVKQSPKRGKMSLKPRRKMRGCVYILCTCGSLFNHVLKRWIILADANTPLQEQPEFPKNFRSALWSCVSVQEEWSAALPWWFHLALLFFMQMIFLRNIYLAGNTIKENSASTQQLCSSSGRFPRSGTSLCSLLSSATAISANFDVNTSTSCRVGVGREKLSSLAPPGTWISQLTSGSLHFGSFCFETKVFEFLLQWEIYRECSYCKQPHHGTNSVEWFSAKTWSSSQNLLHWHILLQHRNANVIQLNIMLERNYMSQTTAVCAYDTRGTICLSSVFIIIPNSPFAILQK